jgi:hypothetical protein
MFTLEKRAMERKLERTVKKVVLAFCRSKYECFAVIKNVAMRRCGKFLRLGSFSAQSLLIETLTRAGTVAKLAMNDMLEILHEAAVAHNAPSELIARHQEMKGEKRFGVKVDYAGALLPTGLRPSGKPNPMAILHELASDGLHAKSNEDCVDIFDACRRTFEYVFGKLRIETEDAKNFVQEMASLAEKKTKGQPQGSAAPR